MYGGAIAPLWATRDASFSSLGSGVALYFRLLRSFITLFAVLTVISLPTYSLYTSGNRVPARAADPLGFARISLGNLGPISDEAIQSAAAAAEGLAAAAAWADSLSNGTSNSMSVYNSNSSGSASSETSFISWNAMSYLTTAFGHLRLGEPSSAAGGVTLATVTGTQASYLVSFTDLACALVTLLFAAVMRGRVAAYVAHAERRKVSTKDYSVYVRGLPPDVTVEEVRDHFSALFALAGRPEAGRVDASGAYIPPRQLTQQRSWISKRVLGLPADFSMAASSVRVQPVEGESIPSQPRKLSQIVPLLTAAPDATGAGKHEVAPLLTTAAARLPSQQKQQPNVAGAKPTKAEQAAAAKADKAAAASARKAREQEDRAVAKAARQARRALDRRQRAGIVSEADPDASFHHRLIGLTSGPVSDVSHCLDPSYLGSWVADAFLLRPVSSVLTAYTAAQQLHQQLCSARAEAKMYSNSSQLRGRYGPDPKRRLEAMKRVNLLGFKLDQLTARLRRQGLAPDVASSAAAASGNDGDGAVTSIAAGNNACIGGAFITFNHEESLQRCLQAYAGSHSALNRLFQTPALRLRHPSAPCFKHPIPAEISGGGWEGWWRRRHDGYTNAGAGYRLWVEAAPDPSEVIHENLEVTKASRLCRVAATNTLALLLVLAAVILMILAQANSDVLTSRLPVLSACEAEVPALYLGSYAAVYDARRAVANGYGSQLWRPSSGGTGGGSSFYRQLDTANFPRSLSSSSMVATNINGNNSTGMSASELIAGMASLPPLQLSRSSDATNRALEDQACGSGGGSGSSDSKSRASVALRYEFGPLLWYLRPSYPSLSIPRWAANQTASPYPEVDATYYTSSSPNSPYFLGSAVSYGFPAEVADVCSQAMADADAARLRVTVDGQPISISDPSCPDPRRRQSSGGSGFCQCAPASSSSACYTLPCFDPSLRAQGLKCSSFPASTLSGCYCVSGLKAAMKGMGAFAGLASFVKSDGDLCGRFTLAYVAGQLLVVAAGAVSAIVNMLLARVIPWLISLERHVSVSDRAKATTIKLAAVQSLNTALTALVINAKLPNGARTPSILQSLGLLSGDYSDFSTGWYVKVGNQICVTMMINTLLPPALSLLDYVLRSRSRRLAAKPGWAKTQWEMNQVYTGPAFDITLRYPLVITFVMVTLLYSGGMPLLYGIAAAAFSLQYWADKFLLLRHYEKPPAFDASLALLVLDLLPLAVLVHLAVAVWTFSGGDILPSGILSPSLLRYVGIDLAAYGKIVRPRRSELLGGPAPQ